MTRFASRSSIGSIAALLMLTAGVAAQEAPKDAAAKALATVQGSWTIATINGQSLAEGGMQMSLVFTGDKYAQVSNGTTDERGSIKIDPAKKPMTIDLNITEGNDAGKLQLGVFGVEGDTMTLQLNQAGATERPAGLVAQDGYLFVILKKAK